MKTTRRTFLGGIAAASVPISTVAASTAIQETQEEKCIRLTKELLTEFSKLPFHGESRGGPYVELCNEADIDSLRYVKGNDGREMLIAMIDTEEASI